MCVEYMYICRLNICIHIIKNKIIRVLGIDYLKSVYVVVKLRVFDVEI